MTSQTTDITAAIKEEISNIVIELYDTISLFHENNDHDAVHKYIESYIKRVTRIGLRLGKSNFTALRDSCVIFHQILEALNKKDVTLTEKQFQQFEVWPTLILAYIENPTDKNNTELILEFLQDPIWSYAANAGDFEQLKQGFLSAIEITSETIDSVPTTEAEDVKSNDEPDAPDDTDIPTGAFDGALFESVQEEILEAMTSLISDLTFTRFTGTPLFTTTNLSLASSNIQSGSSIGLTMDLSVLADLGADLSSHDVCLTVTAPDLTVTEVLAHTDAIGFITISDLKATIGALGNPAFDFDQEGTWGLNAEFKRTETTAAMPGSVSGLSCAAGALGTPVVSLQASSSARNLLVGSSPGYAILVQGRISGDDLGLRSHNRTTTRIYDVLKSRGFDDASIFYFNHDTNQDGFVDMPGGGSNASTGIDEVPTKAALQVLLRKNLLLI